MATKNPFDLTEMLKAYDPDRIAQMFDPKNFLAQMPGLQEGATDLTKLMDKHRNNFDAMVAANKSVAETYRDLLEKQMDIFQRLTAAARDNAAKIEAAGGAEARKNSADTYSNAIKIALQLMQELADAARDSNKKAFDVVNRQVTAAIDELKKR